MEEWLRWDLASRGIEHKCAGRFLPAHPYRRLAGAGSFKRYDLSTKLPSRMLLNGPGVENPIAGIAQAGNDVFLVVQFGINGADINLRVRELGEYFVNSFPSGDECQ